MTIFLLLLLIYIIGYALGKHVGKGGLIFYIGSNHEDYKRALFGVLLK